MSKRPARKDVDHSTSPDELEHRQGPDGAVAPSVPVDEVEEELAPDALEQRLREDGTVDSAVPVDDELPEGPLTPDMIEQRQIVEFDEEAERPEE